MPDDVPLSPSAPRPYDGPPNVEADAAVERARHSLDGHPKDEVFQALDQALRRAGVSPRIDAVEVLARELSYRPNVD